MGWIRSAFATQIQIEDPAEGTKTVPIVWYFAPKSAKLYKGINAFTSAREDRDGPLVTYQLGEQPPYFANWYDGKNIWGYLGQCVIGTPQQFQYGLSAADLAAPLPAVPACCKTLPPPQVWYLRYELAPKQFPLPAGYVDTNWSNTGEFTIPGLLSRKPGSGAGGRIWTFPPPAHQFPLSAFQQYLSDPLPPQTIAAQNWRLACGWFQELVGHPSVQQAFSLLLIDGQTGLVKQTLISGQAFGPQPVQFNDFETDARTPFLPQVTIAAGDYLCLEMGWKAGAISRPYTTLTFQLQDGGLQPVSELDPINSNPMSLLSVPPSPEDPDVPATGTLLPYAGALAPSGYLPCDGTAYSVADFPDLFAVIGNAWGAAGPGQFRVPDLRDRTVIGSSPGGLGIDRPTARPLAGSGGEEAHQLIVNELASHNHNLNDPRHQHETQDGSSFMSTGGGAITLAFGSDQQVSEFDATSLDFTNMTLDPTGGDVPHNNMQPFAVVLWIIKT